MDTRRARELAAVGLASRKPMLFLWFCCWTHSPLWRRKWRTARSLTTEMSKCPLANPRQEASVDGSETGPKDITQAHRGLITPGHPTSCGGFRRRAARFDADSGDKCSRTAREGA